jgi:hypothetical protein
VSPVTPAPMMTTGALMEGMRSAPAAHGSGGRASLSGARELRGEVASQY